MRRRGEGGREGGEERMHTLHTHAEREGEK